MFLIAPKDPAGMAREEAGWRQALADGRISDPEALSDFMLAKVSRTFALNIQVLPWRLRRQVRQSYLFCRMADTLEDDGELPAPDKIRLLESFRSLFPAGVRKGPPAPEQVAAFVREVPASWALSDRWDRLLVRHAGWFFPQLGTFPAGAVEAIGACVAEMCDGMIRFTARQEAARAGGVLIGSLQDLDDYCYFVAGTVGNLLCDLFAIHSPLINHKRAEALKALSVSFGLGLQLTNILKDIHDDRDRNVSYIPQDLLAAHGLDQTTFLSPEGSERAAAILECLIRKANTHLEDAISYSCLLPRLEPRLRLFCLWPLFMAAETLVLLAGSRRSLRETAKLKISRESVGAIVRRTSMACWSNRLIHALFNGTRVRLEAALGTASARPVPAARSPESAGEAAGKASAARTAGSARS